LHGEVRVATQRPDTASDRALLEALARVLEPAARLAVAKGLPFTISQEMLRRAYVKAAQRVHHESGRPTVSRIAAATGLTRREVTRLVEETPVAPAQKPSAATQIFTAWLGDAKLRDRRGQPKPLRRQGPAPSFDALAQSITRDMHSRTLLEELCRLGLARHDAETDLVHLQQRDFVPRGDEARMLAFLGHNVSDHLSASVANVLHEERRHFEQAIFADELSEASIDIVKTLVKAQWRSLMAALVPELEALVKADSRADTKKKRSRADRRMRIGLYAYDERIDTEADKDKET
jgi:Family of unknown function (DUF6502)